MTLAAATSKSDQQIRGILFVASQEINSEMARENLQAFCREQLCGCCDFEIVDVFEDMDQAVENGIIVTPALLIVSPGPQTVIVGNLSDTGQLAKIMNVSTRYAQDGQNEPQAL